MGSEVRKMGSKIKKIVQMFENGFKMLKLRVLKKISRQEWGRGERW